MKRDKEYLETELCEYRNVKGAVYNALRKEREDLQRRLGEMIQGRTQYDTSGMNVLNCAVQGERHNKNDREVIIIVGGRSELSERPRLSSLEMFSWSGRKWL